MTLIEVIHDLCWRTHVSGWAQWASLKVSPTQRRILELLRKHPGLGITEIATVVGVTPATVSDSVKALFTKGLVSRNRLRSDERMWVIALTSSGADCLSMLKSKDPLRTALAHLSETERRAYQQLTEKLLQALS